MADLKDQPAPEVSRKLAREIGGGALPEVVEGPGLLIVQRLRKASLKRRFDPGGKREAGGASHSQVAAALV